MSAEMILWLSPVYVGIGLVVTGFLVAVTPQHAGWAWLFGPTLWPLLAAMSAVFLAAAFLYDIGHRIGERA